MLDKNIIATLGLVIAIGFIAKADAPKGYYDVLDGKSGVALMRAAKTIADGHKAISYSGGTWEAFATTDVRTYNGQQIWWDMYSNEICYTNTGHSGLNVEHSVANSWWGGTKNDAYKDLFHLNPSNADANSRKSNYPLGEIATVTWTNGVTSVGKPVNGQGGGNTYVYEPPKEYKGDFARAFMYIFTTYNDISWKDNTAWMYTPGSDYMFQAWAVDLLLRWAKEDPVSQKEVNRNEEIYKIQGNRNPFIDYPELADYIWGDKKGTAFKVEGAVTPDPDPDPDPTPGPGPVPTNGEWVLVSNAAELDAASDYIIVSIKNYNMMGYETDGSSQSSYFKTAGQALPSGKTISKLPADGALLKMNKSQSQWKIGVYDQEGDLQGYMISAGDKNVSLTPNIDQASGVTITIASDGEATFDFGNASKLKYNSQAPRFTTYSASSQESLTLYRKKDLNVVIKSAEDETFRVLLQGNCIECPENASVYDLQGRIVGKNNLKPGIYLVSDMRRYTKVIVRN